MIKRFLILLALAGGLMTHADAQTYPGQLPANTVLGNGTGGTVSLPTPLTTIPTPTMPALTGDVTTSAGTVATTIAAGAVTNAKQANMAANTVKCNNTGSPAVPIDCTSTQAANLLSVAPWNDTSTVIGSGAKFYNPAFFGNAGTGIVDRFNRVFVGVATATSSDILTGPPQLPTTPGWLDTLFNIGIIGNSQHVTVSALGTLATTGASRSSDFRTFAGAAAGGSQGLTGIGVNDDTTAGTPIAAGTVGIGVHRSGVTGITPANQSDMNSAATTVDITPFGGVVAGNTFASLLTSGAYSTLGTTNISAGWVVALGRTGGPKHRKGGICLDGALDATVGAGGDGVCLEMARNQSVRWLNSTPTTDAEIWANASGVHGTQQIIPISNGAQTQAQNTTAFQVTLGQASETVVQTLCPIAGTFRNLFMATQPAPAAGQTVTATWRVNGVDTAITCQATNGTPSCSDTTHTAACTAGQSYSLKTVTSATSGSINGIQAGIVFVP